MISKPQQKPGAFATSGRENKKYVDRTPLDVDIRHKSLAPVMLLGHGSSGTSILAILLRKYLRISFGTESQFIIRYFRALHRYGNLEDDANLRQLIYDISAERWFARCHKNFGFEVRPEALIQDVKVRTYRGVLDSVFNQLARHNGMHRYGDKTPEYVHDLSVLGELYPDAKYVHLVRDGRDVAHSVFHRYWGPKNAFSAATDWCQAEAAIVEFLGVLPDDRYIEIRYEDLLRQPAEIFSQLIDFLEIDKTDEPTMRQIMSGLDQEVSKNNLNKWQRHWSSAEQLRYERVACDMLRRYGYDTKLETSAKPFALWEKWFWSVDNRLRKWTYLDYWKDNLYKIRLRATDAIRRFRQGRKRAR